MLIPVVDDEAEIRALLEFSLARVGHHVLLAADGVEALHVLVNHCFDVDVVLTDLDMPRLDGRALTEHLSRRAPQLPVIHMTGSDRAMDPVLDVPLLFKPFSIGELTELLKTLPRPSSSRCR